MGYFDPFKYYKTNSPLRSDSRFHKQDLAAIKASSPKSDTATELINQRRDEKIIRDIDRELDQMGRKKVIYDQGAVLLIEHMWPHAHLDPITQRPILRRLLKSARMGTLRRREFIKEALAILRQDYLHPKDG